MASNQLSETGEILKRAKAIDHVPVVTTFVIRNYCNRILTNGLVIPESGRVADHPPSVIAEGATGYMIAHKTKSSVYGSAGILCYNISGDKIMAIRWEVRYPSHYNTLAAGILHKRSRPNPKNSKLKYKLFREMNIRSSNSTFVKKEYNHTCEAMYYPGDGVVVEASMGMTRRPLIEIAVYPRKVEHLADNWKSKISQAHLDSNSLRAQKAAGYDDDA
ncbi:hypothetical protein EB796_019620 [Bugula neritina]|uniref:Uncharacterized protein n=1 Tax=Bugula neritina TaxID=10212 RepID=A0A7J7J920_BUGNE|nr:hypothetical protein EB796_019620 [Bugula neritina]